jgi:glycosyltransferase involved in cell wall biosynthesis
MVVRQVESLRRAGVQVEVMPISGTPASYLRTALSVLRLNLSRRRADVLHAHTGHAGVLACLQFRYPVVLTYVGYDIDDQLEEAQRARRVFERAVFRVLAIVFAATIVKSRRSLKRLPSRAWERSRVIPNGVDRELFRPMARNEARARLGWGAEPTVLFAADPARPVKRFALAQEAVELAGGSIPGLKLVVADRVPPEDMPVWMSAADALLLTSRSEGSPNVVKEAMACNLPVVAVDVGDAEEVIEGTRHCHICRAEAWDLADALVEVVEALPERSDGRERSAGLDQDAIAARVVELYRAALGGRPGVLGGIVRRPGGAG